MSAQFVTSLVVILAIVHVMLLSCAYLIFLERKIAAWTQDRIGPNRTNFSFGLLPFKGKHFGLGQALADGVKLFLKEDYTPPFVDKALFILAPMLAVIPAMLGWAVVPWGGYLAGGSTVLYVPGWVPLIGGFSVVCPEVVSVAAAPISIGVVYILAIGSLAVYGVVVGGYASNNKYAFLGGLRATAQMLSYEIPMGLIVLIMILGAGTAATGSIVDLQANSVWNLFAHPLLAAIFFTCNLAECNRTPFDLAEAESELVGGYHTEYSSMKWALFFLGEYMHMITACAFFSLLFLGGWDLPFVQEPLSGGIGLVLLKTGVFIGKVTFMLFVMMWIRWTVPRFRFDQLMRLAWRGLIPITLFMLLVCGILVYLRQDFWWTYLIANVVTLVGASIIGPLLPQGAPPNRRVGLEGSRFSPPATTVG